MKQIGLKNQILLGLFLVCAISKLIAGVPVWQFTPLTATKLTLSKTEDANVQYLITNNSYKSHTLVLKAIPGITQNTNPGLCGNPFTLPSKGASCILSLQISGSQLSSSVFDGPIVCQQGSTLQCYRPRAEDVLMITLVDAGYTVGGRITALTGSITLLNNGSNAISKSTDGQYVFTTPLTDGAMYFVTIGTQPANQFCTVNNAIGTIQAANVTNVNVVCATNAYTVGGNVSGLSGSVILTNNGTDNLATNNNGSFNFPVPIAEGSPYFVAVLSQPASETCTVFNGAGIMGGSNVTNVAVTCSVNSHTLGGTVTGLTGTVILLNNGTNAKIINSNGSYTFSMPVAEGSNYLITVGTQPQDQTCNITNGSGTMGNSDVNNVNVNCINNTTTLSVSSTGTIPTSLAPGIPNSITVTNTGTNIAYNVSATLPLGWIGVTQDASECMILSPAPPNNTCTLFFSSYEAYVAQNNIPIIGDNISNSPTTALAFTVQGYLVWSVSLNTLEVIDTVNLASKQWGGLFTEIGPPGGHSFVLGKENTEAIVNILGSGSDFAAGACDQSTSGNVLIGTWYLPALCQLGVGVNCTNGLPNIYTNLVELGFGSLAGVFWSSTETSAQSQTEAWSQEFNSSSIQASSSKDNILSIRCVRSLTVT